MTLTMKKFLFASAWISLLIGCGSQPAPVEPRQPVSPESGFSQTAAGMARIYVFNISGWTLIPGNQDVLDNGKPLVSLPRQTYTIAPIVAGDHDLRLHGRKLALNAEAGETYFVVAGYRPERSWAFPLAGDPVVIKQISEEEARPLLQNLKPL